MLLMGNDGRVDKNGEAFRLRLRPPYIWRRNRTFPFERRSNDRSYLLYMEKGVRKQITSAKLRVYAVQVFVKLKNEFVTVAKACDCTAILDLKAARDRRKVIEGSVTKEQRK